MINISDLLGAMMQTGMTRSSNQRLENAFRAGGQTSDNSLASMLGGLGGAAASDSLFPRCSEAAAAVVLEVCWGVY